MQKKLGKQQGQTQSFHETLKAQIQNLEQNPVEFPKELSKRLGPLLEASQRSYQLVSVLRKNEIYLEQMVQ